VGRQGKLTEVGDGIKAKSGRTGGALNIPCVGEKLKVQRRIGIVPDLEEFMAEWEMGRTETLGHQDSQRCI
jgi:hypothetical protein